MTRKSILAIKRRIKEYVLVLTRLSRKEKVAGKLLPTKPPYRVNLIVERYNYVHLFMSSLKTIPELNSKKDPIAEDAASLVAELGEISLGLS